MRIGRWTLCAALTIGCALAVPAAAQSQPMHVRMLAARPAAEALARLDPISLSAVPARSWPARVWAIPMAGDEPPSSSVGEGQGEPTTEEARLVAAVRHPPLRILQIGDSHTAADFLTGELRDRLQARHGDGGLGLTVVGLPTPGVRSSRLKLSASPGWSYEAIQKSAAVERFGLPGFLAEARKPNEALGFAADAPAPYTAIDLEVQTGPDEGAIEAEIDGRRARYELKADAPRRAVLHLAALKAPALLHQLILRTLDARHVAVLGLTILNERGGVSVSNIGFPGATVDILNKFPAQTVIDALRRLAPGVVVLSFGTNEGFNDKLDLARYEDQYGRALALVRAGAPAARIVMVAPSDAERVPAVCLKEPAGKACEALRTAKTEGKADSKSGGTTGAATAAAMASECEWPTPPQLGPVRDWQRGYAAAHAIALFDWSSLMPKRCGAQAWATAEPKLMTADHVHFTREGYRRSGGALAAFLEPIIHQVIRSGSGGSHAVSND